MTELNTSPVEAVLTAALEFAGIAPESGMPDGIRISVERARLVTDVDLSDAEGGQ